MDTQSAQAGCSYVGPDGIRCPDVPGPAGLCVWHDPAVAKTGPEWAKSLEALARSGRSLAGFELARVKLDGIDLTLTDRQAGADLRGVNLSRASLRGAHLYHADFTASRLLKADFTDATINEARFEDADLLGTTFRHARADGTHWGATIRQEREGRAALRAGNRKEALAKFQEAEEIYRDLRVAAEGQGHRRTAGEFFYREMLVRHYRLPRFSIARGVSGLAHILYGYGERPTYIVASAVVYLLAMAAIFFAIGVIGEGRLIVFDPAAGWLANISGYGQCLYYTVITYTTVGYGDITPLAAAKPFAMIVALSGNFMMALFVVVFVRKLAR